MDETGKLLIAIEQAEVQAVNFLGLQEKFLAVDVLRLDKIHPIVSGNKWFKLKYYLQDAGENQANTIVTFGGAWSNHIIASAFVSRAMGFRSVGIIRGERPMLLSQTLVSASDYGMALEFVSRQDYSQKDTDSFKATLREKFGEVYIIPEGGSGSPGVKGSKEILPLIKKDSYSHIICCIGTGTMFSGILESSQPGQQIIGISVLKGVTHAPEAFHKDPLKSYNYKITDDYHFGGYARKTEELIEFMNYFYARTGIPTDFVYTGKLMFAVSDLIKKNYFPAGSKVLVIHSGGLQGNASLEPGTLIF